MSFWSKYGTLNSQESENYAENSTLWAAEWVFLAELAGEDNEAKIQELSDFINSDLKVSEGLYNQLPFVNNTKEDSISHDQITGYIALSNRYNLGFHIPIWKEIKRQWFRYDNINPEKPELNKILHPRDMIFYGMICGSKLWYLLSPILFLMSLFSVFKPKGVTSGKILWWVRINAIRNNYVRLKLLGFYNWLIRGGYGHSFRVYFNNTKHPIYRLSLRVYPRE